MSDLSPALFALQGERADERVRKRPAFGPSRPPCSSDASYRGSGFARQLNYNMISDLRRLAYSDTFSSDLVTIRVITILVVSIQR